MIKRDYPLKLLQECEKKIKYENRQQFLQPLKQNPEI